MVERRNNTVQSILLREKSNVQENAVCTSIYTHRHRVLYKRIGSYVCYIYYITNMFMQATTTPGRMCRKQVGGGDSGEGNCVSEV